MFDYMDGGAEDEISLARNEAGFADYQLLPRTLVDSSSVDLSTTVQGTDIDLPVIFAPTGGTRLFHTDGEKAVVPVAEKAGTIFSLSSMATHNIEDAASFGNCPKWFQIYVWKDKEIVREFIQRCKESGYQALCLTVDATTSGKRERDLRNGMTLPPKFTLSSLFDMALHPNWWWNTLTKETITLANIAGKAGVGVKSATAMGQYAQENLSPSVSWDDVAWMKEEWGGPFMIKGIGAPADARLAADAGVSGVIISNHGGRQLDHAASPIDILPEVVEAVDGRLEVLIDSGIRRGSDVIKALALGAQACLIGRPFLFGLAAGGQAGVEKSIEILRSEIERSMKLLGCTDVKALDESYLRKIR
jgi:L-lactate dehydrogenase (cytochrome)